MLHWDALAHPTALRLEIPRTGIPVSPLYARDMSCFLWVTNCDYNGYNEYNTGAYEYNICVCKL